MNDTPISTRPPNRAESLLREQFAASLAGQSEQMDKLARQLIALGLAVPGIFAAALQVVRGQFAAVSTGPWLVAAFVLWLIALGLALLSLLPRRWKVDSTMLKGDVSGHNQPSGTLSIVEFFVKSAAYKRKLLIPAALIFWLGIACAVASVF